MDTSRIIKASITSDAIFRLLDQHKSEFAGVNWMPANFFQRRRIVYILNKIENLYSSIEMLDFTDLPGEAQLTKIRYQMWLDLRMAKRWQVKDHMRFFEYINDVLKGSRSILERLRRLVLTGQISRTDLPTTYPTINLLD